MTTDAERIQNILDNKYCPTDLKAIVKNCKILNKHQQENCSQILTKFEHLFDGTLGNWNTDP